MPTTMRTVVSEPIVRPERHVVAAYTAVSSLLKLLD